MVAFVPPDINLGAAGGSDQQSQNGTRGDSEFIKIAQSVGIFVGREL